MFPFLFLRPNAAGAIWYTHTGTHTWCRRLFFVLFCVGYFSFKIAFYSLFPVLFLVCFFFSLFFFLGRDESGFGIWPFPYFWLGEFLYRMTLRLATATRADTIYYNSMRSLSRAVPVISQVANRRDKSIIVRRQVRRARLLFPMATCLTNEFGRPSSQGQWAPPTATDCMHCWCHMVT